MEIIRRKTSRFKIIERQIPTYIKRLNPMQKIILSLLFGSILFLSACTEESTEKVVETKYPYESVEDDPLGTRIYTLENGLKVYLSVNKKEPTIQTNIAVRTGSKNDPAETT